MIDTTIIIIMSAIVVLILIIFVWKFYSRKQKEQFEHFTNQLALTDTKNKLDILANGFNTIETASTTIYKQTIELYQKYMTAQKSTDQNTIVSIKQAANSLNSQIQYALNLVKPIHENITNSSTIINKIITFSKTNKQIPTDVKQLILQIDANYKSILTILITTIKKLNQSQKIINKILN